MATARMITVLHVCETAIGGIASYLRHFAHLRPSSMAHVVLLPEDHAHALGDVAAIVPYRAGTSRGGRAAMLAFAVARARRDLRPDIVFYHSTLSLVALAAERARGVRLPAIYCAHGWAASRATAGTRALRPMIRAGEGSLAGLADRVVNISRSDMALAERHGYRGCQVLIENAVPPSAPNAAMDMFADDPASIHLLFVGRFDRQKGLDMLLPAFTSARRKRPDLRLHLIGAGVRGDSLLPVVPDGVTLHGWIDHDRIDDFYASADALIVPSRWEGFGLVVPEALRNGTPVLVSDRGALPDLVEPGRTGAIFRLDPRAIEACLTALEKDDLRARGADCKAAWERRFGIDRWRREMLALIDGLMDAR